jgi:hypothetical protein
VHEESGGTTGQSEFDDQPDTADEQFKTVSRFAVLEPDDGLPL